MMVLHEGNLFLSHLSNERHEEYLQSALQILDGSAIGKGKTVLTGYGTSEERRIKRKKGTRKAIICRHENGTQRWA